MFNGKVCDPREDLRELDFLDRDISKIPQRKDGTFLIRGGPLGTLEIRRGVRFWEFFWEFPLPLNALAKLHEDRNLRGKVAPIDLNGKLFPKGWMKSEKIRRVRVLSPDTMAQFTRVFGEHNIW